MVGLRLTCRVKEFVAGDLMPCDIEGSALFAKMNLS